MSELTSDYCRKYAEDRGITTGSLNTNEFFRLHRLVAKAVINTDLFKGTYIVESIRKKDMRTGRRKSFELHVSAFYFTRREAITFNDDGFIGFCGWSDKINSQPIYRGFIEWCDTMEQAND